MKIAFDPSLRYRVGHNLCPAPSPGLLPSYVKLINNSNVMSSLQPLLEKLNAVSQSNIRNMSHNLFKKLLQNSVNSLGSVNLKGFDEI